MFYFVLSKQSVSRSVCVTTIISWLTTSSMQIGEQRAFQVKRAKKTQPYFPPIGGSSSPITFYNVWVWICTYVGTLMLILSVSLKCLWGQPRQSLVFQWDKGHIFVLLPCMGRLCYGSSNLFCSLYLLVISRHKHSALFCVHTSCVFFSQVRSSRADVCYIWAIYLHHYTVLIKE